MSTSLLELQAADTMSDQLRHRREVLAEREQVQAAKNALLRWNEARTVVRRRIEELAAQIEQIEADAAKLDKHRDKLNVQLKTVIAPREAEALQHEIATLTGQRSELDDAELAALEEHSRLEGELEELLGQEESLTNEYLGAESALADAESDIDGELTRIADRLAGLRAEVEKSVLRRYDRLRKNYVIAAAPLSGSRCEGCHLDLSAAEIDEVRDTGAKNDGIADCPQCGRLLVV
ncbi:MAG: C4-type zinc ribbon domain-containing protein [Ilumatobacteraceae bacterium]